jgi:phosphohistidine phosphatase SixA
LQVLPVPQTPQVQPLKVPQLRPTQTVLQLQEPVPVQLPETLSQLQPVAQVPQVLPQLSVPHCLDPQLGEQLTQVVVVSHFWSELQQASPQGFLQTTHWP